MNFVEFSKCIEGASASTCNTLGTFSEHNQFIKSTEVNQLIN